METTVERDRSGRARGGNNRLSGEDTRVERLGATSVRIRFELDAWIILPAERRRLSESGAREGRS